MALTLEQQYIDEMVAHAKEDAPNECCGIIAGADGRATKLYRMINSAERGYLRYRYEMDGKALLNLISELDAKEEGFFVIYHSHTATEGYPSATDVRFAAGWPDPYYVLVSLMDPEKPVVRAFRILEGAVTEEAIETPE